MAFCVWRLTLSLMFPRIFHVVACIRTSLLMMATLYSFCIDTPFCLSICLLIDIVFFFYFLVYHFNSFFKLYIFEFFFNSSFGDYNYFNFSQSNFD